jgi:NADPH:quinone reductase-like Zn-dependent oxidoreductase
MTGLPDNMAAIEIAGTGGPEVLVPRNVARPRPSDCQILIKVAAAGVNGPDLQQHEGHYPAPKGHSDSSAM